VYCKGNSARKFSRYGGVWAHQSEVTPICLIQREARMEIARGRLAILSRSKNDQVCSAAMFLVFGNTQRPRLFASSVSAQVPKVDRARGSVVNLDPVRRRAIFIQGA